MNRPYRIERLVKQNRSDFDCGVSDLNHYLQKQAGQDQRRRFSVCYLLIDHASNAISGYYSIAAGSVTLPGLPRVVAKKLPRYPAVPVVRIGRLAVDRERHGQKLGGVLLYDAVRRAATTDVGVYAIIVDAISDAAVSFYEHHGFTEFESAPRVLYLTLPSAATQRS